MAYKYKFTFKTEKSTGMHRWLYPDKHGVKYKKIEIGNIDPNTYKIRLHIVENDKGKWITLKRESKSLQEAKEFLNRSIDIY